jgi:hypothetical protein
MLRAMTREHDTPGRREPPPIPRRDALARKLAVGLFLVAVAGGCGETSPDAVQMEIGCTERDDLEPYWVAFEAEGLEEYEGATAVVISEMPLAFEPGACASRAALPITRGQISVELEGRSDGAAYPLVGLYIDRGETGRCDPDADPSWHLTASVAPGTAITFELSAADLDDGGPARCEPFEGVEGALDVHHGRLARR